MQFYDARTSELADQLFTIPSAERNPSGPEYMSLSEYNTFATAQQDISLHPQLADFYLYVEPCCELIEFPLFSKTLKVLDSPPSSNTVIPFQFIDDSHRIGFNTFVEGFKERPYPITLSDKEKQREIDYLHSRNLQIGDDIGEFSQSPVRYIEIYKTTKKPSSFSDFENRLVITFTYASCV